MRKMRTRPRLRRRFTGVIVSVVLILCAFIGGFVAYPALLDRPVERPATGTVDVEGTIHSIGELATAEYGYKITQTTQKPAKELAGIRLPFTSSRVLYSYEGVIKAGISFQDIKLRISESKQAIYVQLPSVRILSSEIDNDSLIVYDEKYSPFNTFTFSDFNLSQADLKQDAEVSALAGGLLDRAEENAKAIVSTSIGNFYDLTVYDIVFI